MRIQDLCKGLPALSTRLRHSAQLIWQIYICCGEKCKSSRQFHHFRCSIQHFILFQLRSQTFHKSGRSLAPMEDLFPLFYYRHYNTLDLHKLLFYQSISIEILDLHLPDQTTRIHHWKSYCFRVEPLVLPAVNLDLYGLDQLGILNSHQPVNQWSRGGPARILLIAAFVPRLEGPQEI